MLDQRAMLIFSLALLQSVNSCQPPTTVFQHDPPPIVTPASAQLAPPVPPPSPQISFPMGNTINDDLSHSVQFDPMTVGSGQQNVIHGPPISMHRHMEFTPYPGYIPPPPEYPTLHQNPEQSSAPAGSSIFTGMNDIRDSVGNSPQADQRLSCPVELHSVQDFVACVQPISFSPSNEKSISCDFEDGTFCRFQPTSSLYQMGKLPLTSHYASIAALSGRPVIHQPSGNFVYVFSQQLLEDDEVAISAPITCQRGSGVLKFNYWLIGDRTATVKVCTQDSQARSCTKPIIYTDSSSVAVEVVHPDAEVFDIEVVTSNLSHSTLFILDNLEYKAELCENVPKQKEALPTVPSEEQVKEFFDDSDISSKHNQGNEEFSTEGKRIEQQNSVQTQDIIDEDDLHPKRSPLSFKSLSACQLLACSFTTTMCQYKNYENRSMSLAEWKLGNHRVGNVHTGIRVGSDNDGGFLFVGTDSSTLGLTTYILESPKFSLNADTQLFFDVYRRSKDITLQESESNIKFFIPTPQKASYK
ncbi:hypothetical protein RB195_013019 [Necator americanus]|uniref:MAM domain-containing protein n=1 Tax=Necator americanus TaxID=51031 RepID=A0ABR1DTM6_NECAM